jgi:hypothetical protein
MRFSLFWPESPSAVFRKAVIGHTLGHPLTKGRVRASLKVSAVLADRVAEALRTSKMAIAIAPNPTAPPAAAPTPAAAKPVTPGPKSAAGQAPPASASTPTDTVKISTAAQTASQEAQETAAQTAKEAGHGDQQAVRLLAKEAAVKKA